MESLHPDLTPFEFLIGEWEGEGAGEYPTISDFAYREKATFTAPPTKPFIHYRQQTWRADDHPEAGNPLHTEVGYIRPAASGQAEMVLAQPTGIVEVLHGEYDESSLRLRSSNVTVTRTAKKVDSTERNLWIEDGALCYEVLIGAVGRPHQLHLQASLQRVQ